MHTVGSRILAVPFRLQLLHAVLANLVRGRLGVLLRFIVIDELIIFVYIYNFFIFPNFLSVNMYMYIYVYFDNMMISYV